ncbi:reverse transcriptase [Beauveria brongniartii RCEF 3172]|uniref:Reverse transcriptase n=1 Tax=Beauveria brongniartii RCEF 3172 TaxID=1081107 RepID=A0A166VVS3_9HYPO|nr:reverse transcriptase [Beauveria brongniartii RCEF 3172]
MSHLAIKHKILHPNQAGALPQRSATDIAAALTHDVEQARRRKKVATLVTMDVEGAFDAILRNRLILQLRRQGWPTFLIRWLAIYLTRRLAKVRFEDAIAEALELLCGIPQGSPLSPILYLLATAALYELPGATQRYGYADDTAMLFIGDTLEETTTQANAAIAAMEEWGRREGFAFDVKKTEVIHFASQRRNTLPPIQHQDQTIKPKPAMRWLGVWFDARLNFTIHIMKWAQKAKSVIYHLRSMSNTIRGISAAAARKAAWAVVMPTLFYGVDVWFPGSERVPKGHLGIIQKTLTAACRMILPSWKTTPKTTLWKEAGIPPAELLLQQIASRNANRWARLDVHHPLTRRLLQHEHEIQHATYPDPATARRTAMRHIRLIRNAALAPAAERPRLIPQRFSSAIWTESKERRPTKERQAERIRSWSQIQTRLVVYSDGSKTEQDTAGFGYAVYRRQQLIAQGCGQISKGEVFNAEIRGAVEGLRATLAHQRPKEGITVYIDNTSIINCIGTTAPPSSQIAFRTFQKTGDAHPNMIRVRWCPGHTKIEGNKLAN